MTEISFAIATFNEEDDIKDCLESIKWADEIVIFDEKSTDKTVQIAKKYTSKVFLVDHDPMFHRTKQKAIDKCKGDWIMQIDADERISAALREEIQKTISSPGNIAGYRLPRKSRIFGKWFEHTGWYPDYQVKLFKKGKGHYPCVSVHEMIEVDGELSTLKNDLLHNHYSTMDWFLNRRFEYTKNDANNLIAKKEKITWSDAVKFPADEFFKRFFLWQGYKDGLHGLVLSLLMAFDRLIVFARMWENEKFWEHNSSDFRSEVINQVKNVSHDWNHWIAQSASKPAEKFFHKFKAKIRI